MKAFRLIYFLSISLLIVLLSNCEKADKLEFGETQYDFQKDSVYQASSDGLLFVQIETDGLSWVNGAIIYADNTPNPTEIIGEVPYFGSITLPIRKNLYWKVSTTGQIQKLIINWTPLQ